MTAETRRLAAPGTGVEPRAGVPSGWLVWSIAVAAYVVAILNRSSLAVAGIAATDRFHITAAQLATFTMLQLLVYALMQVPVGLLVDRFGSRAVLVTGSSLLILGSAAFAFADSYPLALAARFLLGLGDAMAFISVLRLVNAWFSPRRVPLMMQITGVTGQLGAIAAAVPMAWSLDRLGWTPTYLTATIAGIVVLLALLTLVHDEPGSRSLRGPLMSLGAVRTSLSASWQHPGTRLGFWVHFTTGFSPTVFALLWGYPFLVRGEGLAAGTAATLLTCMVLVQLGSGPAMGALMARVPYHRSTMALWIVAAIATVWTAVLAVGGPAPLWLLVVLVVVTSLGAPGSMIGFDLARTSNPAKRLASATGIINQGNFSASLALVVIIGLVLDHAPGGAPDSVEAFRWAMSTQYLFWALGAVQIVRYRRRARALLRPAG